MLEESSYFFVVLIKGRERERQTEREREREIDRERETDRQTAREGCWNLMEA